METFLFALNAVMPIVLLILLGYILKKYKFFSDNFIVTSNKFVYRVALPVSLLLSIYEGDISKIHWSIVMYTTVIIFFLFFIALFSALIFTKDNRRKGVIIQSVYRSNYSIMCIH